MTVKDSNGKPPKKARGREARLAAALRANLRRRKDQVRGRGAGESAGTGTPPKTSSSGG